MEIKCPDCDKYYDTQKINCPHCEKKKIPSTEPKLEKPQVNNTTTQCKYCSMTIQKDAKICPYCQKRLKTSTGVWILTIFFIFIGFNTCRELISTTNNHPITTPSITKQTSSEFIVAWHSGIFWGLLVLDNTTDKQLESLIYKFREAKKYNYLSKIIPVTNPEIIDTENSQITILVFSEQEWATLDQNNKYIHTRGPDIVARSYLNHIRASYEYDFINSKKESGSIGYDEGGLKSEHFKELF